MVQSLMALVLRRVLAWLVWSDEHAKDLEIVVLRHQLQVLRRHVGRPRFRWSDRLFLGAASCHLARETWRAFLVTPQTVLRWHWWRCAQRPPAPQGASARVRPVKDWPRLHRFVRIFRARPGMRMSRGPRLRRGTRSGGFGGLHQRVR
jgi:hypothetical protein